MSAQRARRVAASGKVCVCLPCLSSPPPVTIGESPPSGEVSGAPARPLVPRGGHTPACRAAADTCAAAARMDQTTRTQRGSPPGLARVCESNPSRELQRRTDNCNSIAIHASRPATKTQQRARARSALQNSGTAAAGSWRGTSARPPQKILQQRPWTTVPCMTTPIFRCLRQHKQH